MFFNYIEFQGLCESISNISVLFFNQNRNVYGHETCQCLSVIVPYSMLDKDQQYDSF